MLEDIERDDVLETPAEPVFTRTASMAMNGICPRCRLAPIDEVDLEKVVAALEDRTTVLSAAATHLQRAAANEERVEQRYLVRIDGGRERREAAAVVDGHGALLYHRAERVLWAVSDGRQTVRARV